MTGRIFINYRRGDDPGYTQALYHRLEAEFGRDALFMDVEGYIKAGDDFVQVLDAQVAQSNVLLVVIGPRWIDAVDEHGRRRLDNPDDFVRIEIASALEQKKRVIPVLVNNAPMPRADELPEPMKALARRNAVRLTHDRFKTDVQGLVDDLRRAFVPSAAPMPYRDTDRTAANTGNAEKVAQSRQSWFPRSSSMHQSQAMGGQSALMRAMVLAALGAAAGAVGYGLFEGLPVSLSPSRTVQVLPSVAIGIAVAAGVAIFRVASLQRALLAGVMVAAAWFAADCAAIYSPLFSDQDWSSGNLPTLKLLIWGAMDGLGVIAAVSIFVPSARSVPAWLAVVAATAATSMLFGLTDIFGSSGIVPGSINMAAALAALSVGFWRNAGSG